MTLSSRDKSLAVALPALVVIVGYLVFSLRDKLVAESKKAREVEAAQQAAPSVEARAEQQRLTAQLAKEFHATQTQIDDCKARCRALVVGYASPDGRNQRMDRLMQVLRKHDLDLAEDREADSSKEGKLSPALERLAQQIAELSAGQKPQLRMLRFRGRYADVRQTLQDLGQGDIFAIPVGLAMKTTDDPQRREWTMLVWI